jgi:hypothetical protein
VPSRYSGDDVLAVPAPYGVRAASIPLSRGPRTLIISASYKTDIPAFYGRWFMNRLAAGYCRVLNPYGRQLHTVSLRREDVDGIVFWTKNLGPFREHLPAVRDSGYPFVVQYTVTGYPKELESAVVSWERAVEHLCSLAAAFGPSVGVWRYDPILFTSLTPASFHLERFAEIALALRAVTDEAVVSFAQIYAKTRRNLDAASRILGFSWVDPPDEEKRRLVTSLAAIARENGIQLTVCSQATYAAAEGVRPARCVDAGRLTRVVGRNVRARVKGNRPDCECHQSRDIGDYDTCPHGCVYCYAVRSQALAKERYHAHNPAGEFLFPVDAPPLTSPPGRKELPLIRD